MITKRVFLILMLFLLTSCVPNISIVGAADKMFVNNEPSQLSTKIPEDLFEQTFISMPTLESVAVGEATEPILTPSPTELPTAIPVPTLIYEPQRGKVRALMEEYGLVEEYYLTDEYWTTIYNRIESYGVAERVVALEYHGNNYSMYDGAYAMNPHQFYVQMEYLMKNQYHFVTIHELKGFLDGWLDLPKKSIILTTDSGYASQESFKSITSQFLDLESLYGYKPHMQSYIWTKGMIEEENSVCKEDACWKTFFKAKESGFFTFGTHSETHPQFEHLSAEFLKEDLRISITKIHENIGLNVYAITWPHESCSWDLEALEVIGIDIGFGGLSKFTSDAYVYKSDQLYNCLPRLFPPNGGGYSSRPLGFTLEEMLLSAARINE